MRGSALRILLRAGAMIPALLAAEADRVVEAGPSLYVCPTVGLWQWDQEASGDLELQDRRGLLYGLRAGYAPIEAFAGEIVFLTGTNDADFLAVGGPAQAGVRQSSLELSLIVHFQTLVSKPVYPFLAVGAGGVFRRGGPEIAGESPWETSQFAFHLGGGIKADLGERVGLRFTLRDTFYSDSNSEGNQENQVTVDSVELSAGVEYRVPLSGFRGPKRLE